MHMQGMDGHKKYNKCNQEAPSLTKAIKKTTGCLYKFTKYQKNPYDKRPDNPTIFKYLETELFDNLLREGRIAINKGIIQDLPNYYKDGEDTTKVTKDTKTYIINNEGYLRTIFLQHCLPPSNHRTSELHEKNDKRTSDKSIRLMVSSVNSITENISQFIYTHIKPTNKHLEKFI